VTTYRAVTPFSFTDHDTHDRYNITNCNGHVSNVSSVPQTVTEITMETSQTVTDTLAVVLLITDCDRYVSNDPLQTVTDIIVLSHLQCK
jgi:hypothetical protein